MNRGKKQVGQQANLLLSSGVSIASNMFVCAVALHRPQSPAGGRRSAHPVSPLPGRLRCAAGKS
jgi:hypothetical protein